MTVPERIGCWTDAGVGRIQCRMLVGCRWAGHRVGCGGADDRAGGDRSWRAPVTVPEGIEAAPCDVAPCGAAPCGVSSSDSAPCSAAPCKGRQCRAQGTAAEVESEVAGDGEAAFLAASAAGGMSGRVSPTVFAGAGDDGGAASSRSRFLMEHAGGTRMEAAVAWRNSANASSRIRTRVSREESVLVETGREQHAE